MTITRVTRADDTTQTATVLMVQWLGVVIETSLVRLPTEALSKSKNGTSYTAKVSERTVGTCLLGTRWYNF